jgi:hypothetical protein
VTLYVVFTRTGGKRHVTSGDRSLTLCGREHMGHRSPASGREGKRYTASLASDETICRICRQEAARAPERGL